MPNPTPTAGKKLAAKIRKALALIEASWRNEMTATLERRRAGYLTAKAERANTSSEKQEAQGRPMLTEALAELEAGWLFSEEAAIAEENAIIQACAQALGVDAAQLAIGAGAHRPPPGRRPRAGK